MKYLKLLGWVVLYFAIYLLANAVGGVVLAIAYFVRSIMASQFLPLDAFIATNLLTILAISGILTIAFGIGILFIRGYKPLKYLDVHAMSIKHTALMVLLGATFAIFVNFLLNLIEIDRFLPDPVSESLFGMMTGNMALTFLTIGIIVPIYEEFLVRGLIYKELQKDVKPWLALLLQGLIFGAIHGNLLQFSYAFPMGIFLGYVYTKYRSIWAPILVHLVWNTTSLLLGKIMPAESSSGDFLLLTAVSGILFAGCAIYSIISPGPSSDAPPEQFA